MKINNFLYLGYTSNRLGLDPNAIGLLRIYPSGRLIILGGVRCSRGVKLYVAGTLTIGDGTYLNPGSMIFCRDKITIGKNCAISFNVTLLEDDFHAVDGNSSTAPICIGNNGWIGSNTTILKGVKIGNNVVIGANSVVTKNVPNNTLFAGNPARFIRKITSWS